MYKAGKVFSCIPYEPFSHIYLETQPDMLGRINEGTEFGINTQSNNDLPDGISRSGHKTNNMKNNISLAHRLCQEIAEAAYKDVPELEKVMPKKYSKILGVSLRQTQEQIHEEPNLHSGKLSIKYR